MEASRSGGLRRKAGIMAAGALILPIPFLLLAFPVTAAAQGVMSPGISTSGTDLPSNLERGRARGEIPQQPTAPAYLPAPLPPAPDPMAQALAAMARNDPAEALARFLRVLAQRPNDLEALTGAGRAALLIGDPNAALSFYARAEEIAPRNGRVKAGLGAALVQIEQPRPALRMFDEALDLGVPLTDIASDRGLAYDLRGDNRKAQQDYAVALRANPQDDEAVRRMALSMAIGGDQAGAMLVLDPLLRKQDTAAWRARTFVHALTGNVQEASAIANAIMPMSQAAAIVPFFSRIAELKPAQKAAAVHFGHIPSDGRVYAESEIYADATPVADTALPALGRAGPAVDTRLIPRGAPLGSVAGDDRPNLAQRLADSAPLTRAPRRRPGDRADAPGGGRKTAAVLATPLAAATPAVMPRETEAAKGPPTRLTEKSSRAPATPARLPMADRVAGVGPLGDPADPQRSGGATAAVRPNLSITADIRSQAAEEQRRADAAAELARAKRLADARAIEQQRTAQARVAAQARADAAAKAAEAQRLADARAAEDVRTEQARAAARAKADAEAQRLADARSAQDAVAPRPAANVAAEQARRAAEARAVADAKAAEAHKLAEAKKAAEAKKLADLKKTEAAKKAGEDKKVADARKQADAKKAAELKKTEDARKAAEAQRLADAKKAEETKKLAPPTGDRSKHPQRYWVQVAGGANKADLPKAWRETVARYPKQLAGRTPWTTPVRFTNRLMIGPFKTAAEAQGFVNTNAATGLQTFPVTTPAGQIVERVPAK